VVLPLAADEGTWEGETELIGLTGRRIFGHQVVMAHRDAEGVVQYFSTIIRDITQRKGSEDALRKSEEQLAIMLDSIGDAVVVTDVRLRVTRMNPVAQKLTGWSIFDALGRPAQDIVVLETNDPDYGPRRVEFELDELDGVLSVPYEARLVAADGTSIAVACTGAPMHGRDGETVGAVLVFRDVTEKRQIEDRVRHAQKMEAVGQLAGGVAHDFNNLLSGIMGYAQLLHGSDRPSEQRDRFIEQILIACKRAADLTSQLLSFSRRTPAQSRRIQLHHFCGLDVYCEDE
jgi:PAS domain S-box-containing protein